MHTPETLSTETFGYVELHEGKLNMPGHRRHIPDRPGRNDGLSAATAWQALACGVLEAIAIHSVRLDNASYDPFRQAISQIVELLTNNPNSSALVVAAGTACRRIEGYKRDTQQSLDRFVGEVHEMTKLLMSSANEVVDESHDSETTLRRMQERIGETVSAEDWNAVKRELTDTLNRLQEQSARRKKTTAKIVSAVQERAVMTQKYLASVSARVAAESNALRFAHRPEPAASREAPDGNQTGVTADATQLLDVVTGLFNKMSFEEAILTTEAPRKGMYLAVFYIQAMEHINAHYGDKVGDDALLYCIQTLTMRLLRPTDRLFRWRGPLLCALVEREDSLPAVRREITSQLDRRIEYIGLDGRLMLSIGIAADISSVEMQGMEEIRERIENFHPFHAGRTR